MTSSRCHQNPVLYKPLPTPLSPRCSRPQAHTARRVDRRRAARTPSQCMMLAMSVLSILAALLLFCLLFPSVWASMAGDELLDAHEAGLTYVSTRNPVRETGPPACMAKLIMLRHKIHQTNSRRRGSNTSHARQSAVVFHASPARPPRNAWRFGRSHHKHSFY
ncbi:hypothetical protein BC835DRAFT_1352145 [Cytidiella melzeri]|nr:hypothetical protein BC835DRAFT_1352145 [Cytidiella melzeri]